MLPPKDFPRDVGGLPRWMCVHMCDLHTRVYEIQARRRRASEEKKRKRGRKIVGRTRNYVQVRRCASVVRLAGGRENIKIDKFRINEKMSRLRVRTSRARDPGP